MRSRVEKFNRGRESFERLIEMRDYEEAYYALEYLNESIAILNLRASRHHYHIATKMKVDTPQDITWLYILDIHEPDLCWYTVVLEMLP